MMIFNNGADYSRQEMLFVFICRIKPFADNDLGCCFFVIDNFFEYTYNNLYV